MTCACQSRSRTLFGEPRCQVKLQFGLKKRSLKATIGARLFGRKTGPTYFVSSGSTRGSFLWDDDAFAANNRHVLGRTQKVPDPPSAWNVVVVEPELRARDNSRKD